MDFSVNWLKRYIDTPLDTDRMAAVLTDQGFTVDEIRTVDGDVIFDIDVTTNRPDAMNYLGLARELAASGNGMLTLPETGDLDEKGEPTESEVTVEIADPDLCGRYVARVVKNVKIGPSPAWMQELLNAIGVRPINNVVDITNFVLWETGHPLHAFDARFVSDRRIVVRRARKGETLTTLDGEERKLLPDDLLIADAQRGIALAGIMGGENSEIRDDTQDVIIESAWFDPVGVRKTSKRLALHTDSSHRFERGADIEMASHAADRAAALIAEYGGGTVLPKPVDAYPEPWESPVVRLTMANIRRILGVDIESDAVRNYLSVLGFDLSSSDEDGFWWSVPSYRLDVTREIDLVEEVARLYGYNRIPGTLPDVESAGRETPPLEILHNRIHMVLTGNGFQEAITYSFCSAEDNRIFVPEQEQMVAIANPLSEAIAYMRTSVLASLVPVAARNMRQGNANVKLYEAARRYLPCENIQPNEEPALGVVARKGAHARFWNGRAEQVDVYALKGIVESLCRETGVSGTLGYRHLDHPAFATGAAVEILLNDRQVGRLGELSETVRTHYEVDAELVALEMGLDWLLEREEAIRFKPFSPFPRVERDSAFLLDRSVPYSEIEQFLSDLEIPALRDVRPFDRYEGKGIPEGKVSLALNFVYQSTERTLNSDEVNEWHERIVQAFRERFGASLR